MVPYLQQEMKMLCEDTHRLTKRQCLTLMIAQYDPWDFYLSGDIVWQDDYAGSYRNRLLIV